jgi:hypothetical protein
MKIVDNKNGTWNLTVNADEYNTIDNAVAELSSGCGPWDNEKLSAISRDFDAFCEDAMREPRRKDLAIFRQ